LVKFPLTIKRHQNWSRRRERGLKIMWEKYHCQKAWSCNMPTIVLPLGTGESLVMVFLMLQTHLSPIVTLAEFALEQLCKPVSIDIPIFHKL
jgi:hypothetical protein